MSTPEAVEIASLKMQVSYLTRDLEAIKEELAEARKDIKALTELVANAKGAKWMLIAMISGAATIGALVGKFAPYLNIAPRV